MKLKRKWIIIGAVILCIALGMVGFFLFLKNRETEVSKATNSHTAVAPAGTNFEEVSKEPAPVTQISEDILTEDLNKKTEKEELLPEPIMEAPITTEPVIPKDIYVLPGNKGKVKCYFPDISEYIWEYYDSGTNAWKTVSENTDIILSGEIDELNRDISTLSINTKENGDILVRCKIKYPGDEKESIYQATCSTLGFHSKDIKNISISDQLEAEAGTYIDTLDIPIKITKIDNSEEAVTGLSDLFFCMPKDISSDTEKNGNGITVETVKTTTLENEYRYIAVGENNAILRFRGIAPSKDIEIVVNGTDGLPPEVKIALGEYEISTKELKEPISIPIEISAEDNYTPLNKLLYAFKPKDEKVQASDFEKNSKKNIEIQKNTDWTAYVKDEAGNIGSADIEIIAVDQKAPVIKEVSLENSSRGWMPENVIRVSATDKTALKYSFCADDGNFDSGWIEEEQYKITQNGIWKILVQDAAGNESSEEITVSNIDSQPPVILSVQPKASIEEPPEQVDIGTLEDRVSVTVNGASVKAAENENQPGSYSGANYQIADQNSNSRSYISSGSSFSSERSVRGDKGDKGDKGESGTAGKDGTSYFMYTKYAESATGTNMSDSPTDNSKYIGIYTGTSSMPPASASSYKWSEYKGTSNRLFIRYSDDANGTKMTEVPLETSAYIGICNTTNSEAPATPESYTWSKYRDNEEIIVLQNQIKDIQSQIDNLKTETP